MFHVGIMVSDDILLFLLPIELLSFKLSYFLDLFTLVSESSVSLIIDSLQIWNVTLTFCLGVIVNFKWTLASEEIWVGLWMEIIWYLFSIQSPSNYIGNLGLIIFIVWTSLCSIHSLRISLSSLALGSASGLTLCHVRYWISRGGFSCKDIVSII